MPATAVLVPGKLAAFTPDAAAPRVGDREEGVCGRGVVLAVGVAVGEEKPGAGTVLPHSHRPQLSSPDACRRQLAVLPHSHRSQLSSPDACRRQLAVLPHSNRLQLSSPDACRRQLAVLPHSNRPQLSSAPSSVRLVPSRGLAGPPDQTTGPISLVLAGLRFADVRPFSSRRIEFYDI